MINPMSNPATNNIMQNVRVEVGVCPASEIFLAHIRIKIVNAKVNIIIPIKMLFISLPPNITKVADNVCDDQFGFWVGDGV
jgi:hypothetical protein